MTSLFTELLFWSFLGCTNLLVSVLVYSLTSLDLLQTHLSLGSPLPPSRSRSKSPLTFLSPSRSSSRSTSPPSQHLSTRKIYTGPSFPPAFIYFPLLAALLNLASAFLRFKQIHSLDFSALSPSTLSTYLFVDLSQTASMSDSHLILSLYGWMCFLVSLMFLVCAMYNLASVRVLVLREKERSSTTWILGRSLTGMFRKRPVWSLHFWTSYWTPNSEREDKARDTFEPVDGLIGNQVSNHSLSASIRSRSHTIAHSLPPVSLRQPPRPVKKGHCRTVSSSGCSVTPGFGGEVLLAKESESATGSDHIKSV